MRDLELLTTDEVAQLLRVSNDTVCRLAAAGELHGRKVGRAWRFPRAAVEGYFRRADSDRVTHLCCNQDSGPDSETGSLGIAELGA